MRALAALLVATVGCAAPAASEHEPTRRSATQARASLTQARLRELRGRESVVRADYSPWTAPPWIDVSGPDPYRVVAWPGPRPGFVGALRGLKALVTLDQDLSPRGSVSLPEAPTALCASGAGLAFVGSRYGSQVTRVALGEDGSARVLSSFEVPGGVVDLACDQRSLYALTQQPPRILTLELDGRPRASFDALPGGLRLQRHGQYLLESSLFERAVRLLELDARGAPRAELASIRHDGPIWALSALEHEGALVLAVSGVEDRPLVRVHGEFENIDSYVFLYRYAGRLERLLELNVGEHGAIVPKSLSLTSSSAGLMLTALSAGSPVLLRVHFTPDLTAPPRVEREVALPGASDAVFSHERVVFASPLLDAWVDVRPSGVSVHHVERAGRPEPAVRLGEALFFTELIAPENVSHGRHSRFSCETCHFEGGVDGRTHFTGRADVSVVTKPLFGLANNRPHFSRALDPDLSAVAHNEFRVAGAGSGSDPWFTLEASRFPWLRELGLDRASFEPSDLREALLRFLYAFSHEPNPAAQGRTGFSKLEAKGAALFEQKCESCHAARAFADEPSSRAPRERWEELVLRRNAPLVWARGDYEQTGILPYVHERGTRVTSLRRLALKPRYFTNGSAPTLSDVLERFRSSSAGALHAAPPDASGEALDEPARAALLAFLRLL